MTGPVSVSAIIPFYGDPEETLPLVDALRDEALTEIIVVDDQSPIPFPELDGLRVIRRPKNGGFGRAVNSGAAEANGEFLLVLNSDLTIHPGFVAALVEAAAPHQPGVMSPAVREHGRLIAVGRRWPTASRAFFAWLTPLARWRNTGAWQRLVGHIAPNSMSPEGGRVDWVMGACMLIPTTAFRQVGGFDERFFMNSEEVDLQRRLTSVDVPSNVLSQVVVEHVGGGSSDPARRRQWLVDGLFLDARNQGFSARLSSALRAASVLNYCWNSARRLFARDVHPAATLRAELGLIRHGRRCYPRGYADPEASS